MAVAVADGNDGIDDQGGGNASQVNTERFWGIPDELRAIPAWVTWELHWNEKYQKNLKMPKAIGRKTSKGWNDPKGFVTLDEIIRRGAQPGFVPMAEFGITVVDLDGCLDANGNLSSFAKSIVDRLSSWTELSQSGRGLHIFVKSGGHGACGNHDIGLEFYHNLDKVKFIAMTGDHLEGTPLTVNKRQGEMDEIYREYLAKPVGVKREGRAKPPTKSDGDRSRRHYSNVCLLVEMGLSDDGVKEGMSRRWADCPKWNREGNYQDNLILAVREELGLFY